MTPSACVSELAGASRFASTNEIISSVVSFYLDGVNRFVPVESPLRVALVDADSDSLFHLFSSPMLRHFLTSAIVNNAKPKEFASAVEGAERIYRELQRTHQASESSNGALLSVLYSPRNSDRYERDAFGRLFQEQIASGVSTDEVEMVNPTVEDIKTLSEAIEILESIVPEFSSSLLPHVGRIVLIDYADKELRVGRTRVGMGQNVSTHAIPGTIFLSPSPLRNSAESAEAILHEAAHKKLSDLVLTRDVFREGYDLSEARTVEAIWNKQLDWNDNVWTTDRALFAFHVYVYLVYYYSRVLQNGQGLICESFASGRLIAALRRADYLGRALNGDLSKDLGDFGRDLIYWQAGLLELISKEHKLGAIDIHLYMDRFDRDTRFIQRILTDISVDIDDGEWDTRAKYKDWPVKRTITHLLHSDLVSLNRILFALGEDHTATLPNYDGEQWSSEISHGTDIRAIIEYFLATRRFIALTLRSQSQRCLEKSILTRRERPIIDLVVDLTEHACRHIPDLENKLESLRHANS